MSARDRWMRVAIALAITLSASCTTNGTRVDEQTSDPTIEAGPPWAEEALVWTDALVTLTEERGGSAYEFFWSPEVNWDIRPMVPAAGVLSAYSARNLMRNIIPPNSGASIHEGSFISTKSVVFLNHLDWSRSGNDDSPFTSTPAHLANILGPIGMNGAEQMVSAMTTQAWDERRDPAQAAREAERIAARWAPIWSASYHGTPEGLYASDAVVIDSIAGRQAEGIRDIDFWAAASEVEWTIHSVGGQAAIYPLSEAGSLLRGLILIVDGRDSNFCPGQVAVVLHLESGLIVREERYWDIVTARRCLDSAGLPPGWWNGHELDLDHPPVPVEDLETVTGRVRIDGALVEVRNGTTALNDAIVWTGSRFELAGLEPPIITSLTFTLYSPFCDHARGRASWSTERWDVYLCFSEEDLCVSQECQEFATNPKHTLLHEFAHTWLVQNVEDSVRREFTELVGLDEWANTDVPWEEQAREHAAEIIAWGLMDISQDMSRIGRPSDELLTEAFILLTTVDPLSKRPDR